MSSAAIKGRLVMWVPIDHYADEELASLPQPLAHRIEAAREVSASVSLSDGEYEYAFLDKNLAGSLSAGLFEAEAGVAQALAVASTLVFSEEKDAEGHLVRVGAGTRLAIGVTVLSGSAKLGLPAIAAAVELKQASASYRFQWRGLDLTEFGPVLASVNVDPANLTIEKYPEVVKGLDALRVALLSHPDGLTPRPLSTWIEDGEYEEFGARASVAQSFALSAVADGWTLDSALDYLSRNNEPLWTRGVEAAYSRFAPGTSPRDNPSDDAIQRAADTIGHFRLRDE
jgi:hypothetical protein